VRAFGDKVFEVIEGAPDRLREVDGIGPVRAASILAATRSNSTPTDATATAARRIELLEDEVGRLKRQVALLAKQAGLKLLGDT
jgi:hypothetical protein